MRALLPLVVLLLSCRPFGSARQEGHGRQEPDPTPRPIVVGRPAPPPPDARQGPRMREFWYLEAVTRDGTQALLRLMPHGRQAAPRLRLVDVDRGAVVAELPLEALAKLPRQQVPDLGVQVRFHGPRELLYVDDGLVKLFTLP